MTRHRCRIVAADRSAGIITVEPDTYPAALVVGKQALIVMDPRAVVISESLARDLLAHVTGVGGFDGAGVDPATALSDAIVQART